MDNKILVFVALLLLSNSMCAQVFQIPITDASSLVRVGMNPHPVAEGDTLLAYTLMSAIDRHDTDSLEYVQKAYSKKSADDKLKEKSWGALSFILKRMLNETNGEIVSTGDILTEDLYHYFTDNECEHLRNYLVLKYELNNYRPRSIEEHINQRTFYDDFLMYNDPYRDSWDKTEDIMSKMPLRKGDKVVDVGCGFGYNAYRLLKLVGENGVVYATDTEEQYIDHLAEVMDRHHISSIKPVLTQSNTLGIDDQVDCIFMSSLYHIIYTWSREDERSEFLTSIKEHLHEGGYFVIVDNYNRNGEELNNCHVDPRLVQAQLGFWGFEQVSLTALNDQRYMLIFKRNDKYNPMVTITDNLNQHVLNITGQKSVVHIGSLDSYDITDRGIDAAQYVYDYLCGGDKSLAEIAIKKYDELIPEENFGGEYSALQWICEASISNESKKMEMLSDPLNRSFYHYLTDDDSKILRYYLLHKYKLGDDNLRMMSDSLLEMSGEVGRTHRSYLEDYILALNPNRHKWENTSLIIENLGLKEGETIADIGCGSGYFSYQFSKLTGDNGRIYAIEIKDEHIEQLNSFILENKINNITVLKGQEDKLLLPERVDKMFMCSLYHIMYGVTPDNERDSYLKTLVGSLKQDGELIIVDNGPVDDNTLPYHGPYIAPELIVKQLSFYGFELDDFIQIIPQRYMLKFKLKQ